MASATICCNTVYEPVPVSAAPVMSVSAASASMLSVALDGPNAPGSRSYMPIPRPTSGGFAAVQPAARAAASSVSRQRMCFHSSPSGATSPSVRVLRSRNSSGSRPSSAAIRSMWRSTPNTICGAPGARMCPAGTVFV